ncbi:cysteine rich repeat-containing protein [Bdellovibrio sp. HCB337]|uniref:cysteine rich repeat-containing protein n=1 Tax=Bdellovibrio sp. HCB337 TaxID=3394358 RepID=UPI0039A70524
MMKIIGIAACILGFSLVASAHQHEGPCMADKEAYCKDVTAGHGAIVKCLKENEAKLKPECQAHMKAAKEAMKDVKEACHEDFEKFCHDVKPGGGRIIKCMKEHEAELSATCKTEIAEKKGARKKR